MILTICVIMSLFVLGSGCSKDDGGDMVLEKYDFELEDSILNSESHELSLSVYEISNPGVKVADWNILQIALWDSELPGDRDDKWLTGPPEIVDTSWVKVENKNGELYVKVKPNDTDEERRVRIMVGKTYGRYDYLGIGTVIISQLPEEKEDDNAPFEVQVRYKGKLYSSIATLDDNDELVYESMELDSLMESLMNRKDLYVVVTESGIMSIFDSGDAEALDAITDMRTCVAPGTPFGVIAPDIRSRRSEHTGFELMEASSLGFCGLFDDEGFWDTYVYKNLMNYDEIYDIINLKGFNLNDKVTSLSVAYNGTNEDVCAVLTVWEDTYFNFEDYDRTKHRVSFIATYNNRKVTWKNLKTLQCINSHNSWNDRISSFSFHFGYYNNYWKDY